MLAVRAPGAPPGSARDFLDRLDAAWLSAPTPRAVPPTWPGLPPPARTQGTPSFGTLRFDRLGPGVEGTARLTDADAWYFALEGSGRGQGDRDHRTSRPGPPPTRPGERRTILLAADDHSVVSLRVHRLWVIATPILNRSSATPEPAAPWKARGSCSALRSGMRETSWRLDRRGISARAPPFSSGPQGSGHLR